MLHEKIKNSVAPLSRGAVRRTEGFEFGTDIIVGFPTESEKDFQYTLSLCQEIGFKKIHTFRYSPRPGTEAQKLFESNPKIKKTELKERSVKIRNIKYGNK